MTIHHQPRPVLSQRAGPAGAVRVQVQCIAVAFLIQSERSVHDGRDPNQARAASDRRPDAMQSHTTLWAGHEGGVVNGEERQNLPSNQPKAGRPGRPRDVKPRPAAACTTRHDRPRRRD